MSDITDRIADIVDGILDSKQNADLSFPFARSRVSISVAAAVVEELGLIKEETVGGSYYCTKWVQDD